MNHTPLENFLLQFYPFNEQQLQLISGQATTKAYQPGQYFSEAGRTAHEIGFVVSGVFRVCYFDKDGNEITKYFIDEGEFMVDLHSYQFQLPSTEYVQAVTACEVLVFKGQDWQALGHTITDWYKTEANIISRALIQKVNRLSPLVHEDAATKYDAFLTRYPGLANRIPLTYLASYIGITPQTLSRLRRNQ